MPSEWPRQRMVPVSRTKTATASQEKKSEPPTIQPSSMALHQSDFTGLQRTLPATGSPVPGTTRV